MSITLTRGKRQLAYFRPSDEQLALIGEHVRGQIVTDLGCGRFLAGTKALLEQGATAVLAVDHLAQRLLETDVPTNAKYLHERLNSSWKAPVGSTTALLSWPAKDIFNDGAAWDFVLPQFKQVIYLGRNDFYTACGNQRLWKHLATRKIVKIVEGDKADLIIYGSVTSTNFAPRCREEKGAKTFLCEPHRSPQPIKDPGYRMDTWG